MVKEINQLYSINLESIKKVFESIIKDEEHHRELLATMKEIIDDNPIKYDTTPKVKYQNPDSWISSSPPTTHDSR
jgi:rubrerythrin